MEWPFERLRQYKDTHGDKMVPKPYQEDLQLGRWANQQRQKRKRGKVPQHRIEKLNSLGFNWEPVNSGVATDAEWQENFDVLKAFRKQHGHTCVPASVDVNLHRWVVQQRMVYHGKQETREYKHHLAKLKSIDFDFAPFGAAWMKAFERLKIYKSEKGNCLVPCEYAPDPLFGGWVNRHRYLFRKGKLSKERKRKLDSLGFRMGGRTFS